MVPAVPHTVTTLCKNFAVGPGMIAIVCVITQVAEDQDTLKVPASVLKKEAFGDKEFDNVKPILGKTVH